MLSEEIASLIDTTALENPGTKGLFIERVKGGKLTRDENSKTHFCIYFLPYNPKDKKVFIVHHKKSGLWISPGGHIDKGESLNEALKREINEELGLKDFFNTDQTPFLLTTVKIPNPNHPCDMHYDLWYLVETDGSGFNLDMDEFYDAMWLSKEEVNQRVIDPSNRKALEYLQTQGKL